MPMKRAGRPAGSSFGPFVTAPQGLPPLGSPESDELLCSAYVRSHKGEPAALYELLCQYVGADPSEGRDVVSEAGSGSPLAVALSGRAAWLRRMLDEHRESRRRPGRVVDRSSDIPF